MNDRAGSVLGDRQQTAAAHEQITRILPRFLPLASDETLVAYQALMQEELESLRKIDPVACVEMLFPSGKQKIVAGSLPRALAERELALMTKVFQEADAMRGIKPSRQAAQRVAQRAVVGMTQEQLLVFSDEGTRNRSEPMLICNAAISFFTGLNAIPPSERGRSLRVFYASI